MYDQASFGTSMINGLEAARREQEMMQQPTQNRLAGMAQTAGSQPMQGEATPQALSLAASAQGLNETTQKAALQEYLANGGQNLDPATTAWCAAFVNATLAQAGQEGTGSNLARSFLDWGQEVSAPQVGDLAVFSRGDPNGWQGHVGFYQGTNPDGTINILGGNQSNEVNVTPYAANRLLGYRRAI